MPGHGIVLTSTNGQDDASLCVDSNGGSEGFDVGTQDAVNVSGKTLTVGDVVECDWNDDNRRLEITKMGTKASGEVNEEGTQINISDSGDTQLSGTVNVSSEYGENEGWAGSNACCGNVNGEASYLCE